MSVRFHQAPRKQQLALRADEAHCKSSSDDSGWHNHSESIINSSVQLLSETRRETTRCDMPFSDGSH